MCHVLIIEDEWLIAEYLFELVSHAGATSVATASTEQDAISAARRQKPEIILSDVNLHIGTGPRAVQVIMAEAGAIPVIFITGTPEDCHPCKTPAEILGKPIERQRVLEAFQRLAPI